jgi:hypothetical protein
MDGKWIETVLMMVRDDILNFMRKYGHPNPEPSDINDGFCFFFAEHVRYKIPEAKNFWASDRTYVPMEHCIIEYNGRYYDAECIEGVDDWLDLPIYRDIKWKLSTDSITSRSSI